MAVSTISNEFNMGPEITCILEEGAPTVGTGYTATNLRLPVVTWASELHKGEIVALDTSTENTHDACLGLPVVRAITAGDATILGIIEKEPYLEKVIPSTAAAATHALRLAGEYYRVATVRFFGVQAIGPATILTKDVVAITPGVIGTLIVDNGECVGAGNGIVLNDVANGGTGIFSFHYCAKTAAGSYFSLLCGFTGMLTSQA